MRRAERRRARRGGDEAEFETFYRLHERRVRHFVRRRVQPTDADDIIDETFYAAWRHFDRLRANPAQQVGWLFITARNQMLNHFRSAQRRSRLAERLTSLAPAAPVETPFDVTSSDKIVMDEHFTDVFTQLSDDDRFILSLVAWDECTTAELAAVLGCSESAAKSRLSRARERFRHRADDVQRQQREGGDETDERRA